MFSSRNFIVSGLTFRSLIHLICFLIASTLKCWPHPSVGFPGGTSDKEPTCQRRWRKRRRCDPWVRTIPCKRAWQPTPVFLPGESHRQRTWQTTVHKGRKGSDTTEVTLHSTSFYMHLKERLFSTFEVVCKIMGLLSTSFFSLYYDRSPLQLNGTGAYEGFISNLYQRGCFSLFQRSELLIVFALSAHMGFLN